MITERNLVIFPLLHARSEHDFDIKNPTMSKADTLSRQLFAGIRLYLRERSTTLRGVYVYQDSLYSEVAKNVNAIFGAKNPEFDRRLSGLLVKSPNMRALRYLVHRGAVVMGTETQELMNGISDSDFDKNSTVRDIWMEDRDMGVAQVIDKTLPKGKEGILFMGAAHIVEEYLPDDIKVHTPKEIFKFFDRDMAKAIGVFPNFDYHIGE